MKTKKELETKLKEVEADEHLGYPLATLAINAPLALIQLSLETKRDMLKWVLSETD